jgi:hypothetical protein
MNAQTTEVLITDSLVSEHGKYITGACGNITAMVGITRFGIQVICQNAAHRCWRGSGRKFRTIAEAVEAYRKPEMKAIIHAAEAFQG